MLPVTGHQLPGVSMKINCPITKPIVTRFDWRVRRKFNNEAWRPEPGNRYLFKTLPSTLSHPDTGSHPISFS
jgi:hypothetical protein